MPVSCWMRRSGQPSRPSAMTCCRFSSLKTLLTSMEGNPSVVLNVLPISIGRFSAVPHWPVLGVPQGSAPPDFEGVLQNMKSILRSAGHRLLWAGGCTQPNSWIESAPHRPARRYGRGHPSLVYSAPSCWIQIGQSGDRGGPVPRCSAGRKRSVRNRGTRSLTGSPRGSNPYFTQARAHAKITTHQ